MQTVINKILAPHTALERIFPADADLKALKPDIRRVLQNVLQNVFPVEKPYLVNFCGLPASGKSHLCRRFKSEHPEALYISFDALMESLPVYIKEHQTDRQKSFERWELPARFIGYQLLKGAVRHKLPIVFEHSNATPFHIELYEKIKQAGYIVDIRYIDADVELVLPRLEKRERYFSPKRTKERAVILKKLLPSLKHIANYFHILPPWKESR